MNHIWQTGVPDKDWIEVQARLKAHFLQGSAWAAFQMAQDKKTFYANDKNWSFLAILESGRFGKRLYCPYGPTATSLESLQEALNILTVCAKEQNVTFIRIEPQGPFNVHDLKALGLHEAHRNIQPRFTFIKDLLHDEDALLAEMTATNRNLHRTAAKKGISFRTTTDPSEVSFLLDMLHDVAVRNSITIHSDSYFKIMAETLFPLEAAKLFIAEVANEPVAASLVFDNSTTRYYAHAAARHEARKLHPGTPLVSHMIFDAKHTGKTAFDFYGIAPPNQPDHPWTGFTKFKQSFGGQIVDLHGTWELPIKKLQHLVYRTLAKHN